MATQQAAIEIHQEEEVVIIPEVCPSAIGQHTWVGRDPLGTASAQAVSVPINVQLILPHCFDPKDQILIIIFGEREVDCSSVN